MGDTLFRSVAPMLEMARIQSEINRLFDNLLELGGAEGEGSRAWMPIADIREGPDSLCVTVEVPGVRPEELELSVNGGNIIVRGEKRPPQDASVRQRHQVERAYGRFERVIAINAAINTHQAVATLRDGVLKIVFPKVSNRRGGEVQISVREA